MEMTVNNPTSHVYIDSFHQEPLSKIIGYMTRDGYYFSVDASDNPTAAVLYKDLDDLRDIYGDIPVVKVCLSWTYGIGKLCFVNIGLIASDKILIWNGAGNLNQDPAYIEAVDFIDSENEVFHV